MFTQSCLRCSCVTDPGQQPYGLQEALSVGRVEDPNLQQVLVFHHITALQSNKTTAKVSIYAAYFHTERTMQQCLQVFSKAPHRTTFMTVPWQKNKQRSCPH